MSLRGILEDFVRFAMHVATAGIWWWICLPTWIISHCWHDYEPRVLRHSHLEPRLLTDARVAVNPVKNDGLTAPDVAARDGHNGVPS